MLKGLLNGSRGVPPLANVIVGLGASASTSDSLFEAKAAMAGLFVAVAVNSSMGRKGKFLEWALILDGLGDSSASSNSSCSCRQWSTKKCSNKNKCLNGCQIGNKFEE
uniref:Uncharacterized protein n=1 Tax=Romanomermis culicivorax TaxID=13658 RepID=A0A915I046_ROMCU